MNRSLYINVYAAENNAWLMFTKYLMSISDHY